MREISCTIYLHKLLRRSKTSHAEGHQDPTPGMAAFGWILGQLLADLTIDFIPATGIKKKNRVNEVVFFNMNRNRARSHLHVIDSEKLILESQGY